jgi:hypothetical protein
MTFKNTNIKLLLALFFCICSLMTLQSCASFKPKPIDEVPFKQHAKTKTDGPLRVSCAVLTNEESKAIFDIDLASKWIQAVWIGVENNDVFTYWLLSSTVDPDYYSPDEVAYSSRFFMSEKTNEKMVKHFRELNFKNPIFPGTETTGFIFVNLDEGDKEINVELLAAKQIKNFTFFFSVPGLKAHSFFYAEAHHPVDQIREVGEEELRLALQNIPCCTTNKDGTVKGDPLNIALIGNPEDLFPAFVRRDWHPAEETYSGSVWKTIKSFIFGKRYRYSPVSPLYLFGRKQDIALQKARGTIHQRNHLRLWITPLRFKGKEVWIGQISRDIGIRYTTKSPYFVTHKIDPDVDEARNALSEDMLFSQGLVQLGYVTGVGLSTPTQPKKNLTGDPYFTDGLRAVLLFDRGETPIREVRFFDWEMAPPDARELDF